MTYTGNINDNVSRSMKIPIRFSKEEKFGQKNSLVYYTSFKPDGMSEMDMNNIKALYSQYYGTMTPSRVNFYMPDDKIENCLVCRYFSFTGKGGGAKGDLIAISDGTYFWFLADPNNKHNRLVVNGLINHDLEINGKIYPAGTKLPHMELNFGNRSLTMKYTVSLFVYVKELFDAGCYALAEFRSGTAKDRDTALSALTQYRKLMELQKKTILEFPITAYRAEKATMTPYKKDELISYWQFTPMAKVNPQPAIVKKRETSFKEAKLIQKITPDIPDYLFSIEAVRANWPDIAGMSKEDLLVKIKAADEFFKGDLSKYSAQTLQSGRDRRIACISAYLAA